MVTNEELQKMAVEYELLRQDAAAIESKLMEIEARINEMEILKESVSKIKGEKGSDVLIPLGSGVFLKGKISDDEKCLVNVGANVVVEKEIEDAKKLIDEQIKELEKIHSNMRSQLEAIASRMDEIEPILMKGA